MLYKDNDFHDSYNNKLKWRWFLNASSNSNQNGARFNALSWIKLHGIVIISYQINKSNTLVPIMTARAQYRGASAQDEVQAVATPVELRDVVRDVKDTTRLPSVPTPMFVNLLGLLKASIIWVNANLVK